MKTQMVISDRTWDNTALGHNVAWETWRTDYPRNRSIQELFAQQVASTPDAIAIVSRDTQLTYRELNARANQVAWCLRAQGVTSDTMVGLFVERSVEAIVGTLAILKAGGVYVPLDPTYPDERLSFMVSDTDLSLVVTLSHLSGRMTRPGLSLFCLDNPGVGTVNEDFAQDPPVSARAESPCYVMYTSGSTGRPKGVTIPHRAVVRLVKNSNYATMDEHQVYLQLAPLSFDAATFEIWAPLLNGGRLAIMPPQTPSLQEISTAIKQHGVTTLWLTAGLFHTMVDHHLEGLRPLRQLLAGGDALSVSHVRRFLTSLPNTRLINGYGPTETTTFAVCHQITMEDTNNTSIPIGKPIANSEAFILDPEMRRVPVGTEGELYLGGDGLAHGYLNRPELTTERFVPHPFATEFGARLYRTGDRVRWRTDGIIEFLGRVDQQVKIRGFRIEPEEIEQALLTHPSVRQAVVVPREMGQSSKELFGYVVLDTSADAVTGNALRRFLGQTMPEYMVPAQIIILEALPLTPNGKVDRRELPAPESIRERPEQDTPYVAPNGDLEKELVACWENLLRVAPLGTNDSVFDLGAQSLHVIKAHQEISRFIAYEPDIALFFQYPTPRSLAKQLVSYTVEGGSNNRAENVPPKREAQQIQDRARLQREALKRLKERR
jgi:amino acid adenylation domain-containing protein